MNKKTESQVEMMLQQMSLKQVPQSLDDSISRMSRESTGVQNQARVAGMSAAKVSQRSTAAWVAVALAACFVGFIIGSLNVSTDGRMQVVHQVQTDGPLITPAVQMKEVAQFQDLHGHSTREGFQACSNCHEFAAKEEQVVEKWDVGRDAHHFGQKCTNCHVVTSDQGLGGLFELENPHAGPKTWVGSLWDWWEALKASILNY